MKLKYLYLVLIATGIMSGNSARAQTDPGTTTPTTVISAAGPVLLAWMITDPYTKITSIMLTNSAGQVLATGELLTTAAEFASNALPGIGTGNIVPIIVKPVSGASGPIVAAAAGTGTISAATMITATGWIVLIAGGGFLIYESGNLLYYQSQLPSLTGTISQPANNLTPYENWYATYESTFYGVLGGLALY